MQGHGIHVIRRADSQHLGGNEALIQIIIRVAAEQQGPKSQFPGQFAGPGDQPAADALKPVGAGAFAVMRYDDNGRTAGVACDAGGRTFVTGFPFESISDEVQRDRLMRDVLRFLSAGK